MKKIALISTFCDTDEKIYTLLKNIKKLKEVGLDTLVISPIKLPSRVIEISDFVFFTKENPIFNWPQRGFTFWQSVDTSDGWVTMHRNVADYGWAGLYQVKKMSQIALSYDYDIFYHLIYDLDIDDYVINSIKNNDVNLIHPRINPKKNNEMWDATLHYMIFDRDNMVRVANAIDLEDYLGSDGVAEGQAHKWSQIFPINLAKTPVKDTIYYWGDNDFFNYSKNPKYKLFISKNENNTEIWVDSEDGKIPKYITSNLSLFLHGFNETQNLKIEVNGLITEITLSENKMIEFPVEFHKVRSLKITDNEIEFDYFDILNGINRNLIYFEK